MNRKTILSTIDQTNQHGFDVAIIGGGATGLGCALDAAARGFRTVLVEMDDFGKGTSSKSTKLVHGGVRYLEQGNVFLVREALVERGRLLKNAPHLVHDLRFVIPSYSLLKSPYFLTGLTLYDLLAGRRSFGGSRWLNREKVLEELPNVRQEGLKNGILYHDGQFDDTRLIVSILRSFQNHGGMALNYARVSGFLKNNSGQLTGLQCLDRETDTPFDIRSKVVVNATGVFSEGLQNMDSGNDTDTITPSQGSHLVLDSSFLGGRSAMMIPKTPDGRVLFALPWHGHTLLGTTDVATDVVTNDPKVGQQEVDFMLETAGRYLEKKPRHDDILSIFAGLRPLVSDGSGKKTGSISRSHRVSVSSSGLVSIMGGKWTTYRKMAEDTITKAMNVGGLSNRPCKTKDLVLQGGGKSEEKPLPHFEMYGSDAPALHQLEQGDSRLAENIHPRLPYRMSEVAWACRHEMARTVEDVLARRTRMLFLDAQAAMASAVKVAELMKDLLEKDDEWSDGQVRAFRDLAKDYLP